MFEKILEIGSIANQYIRRCFELTSWDASQDIQDNTRPFDIAARKTNDDKKDQLLRDSTFE